MASIQHHKNSTSVVYYYIDAAGNRKQKWESFPDEKEAMKRKTEIEFQQAHDRFISPNNTNVRQYFERWIPIHTREFWGLKTYTSNMSLILNHIYPHLGDQALQSLDHYKMDTFFDMLRIKKVGAYKCGQPNPACKTNKTLSNTTIKIIYDILNAAFERAIEWKLIAENPLPSKAPKKNKTERAFWSESLVRQALDDMQDDPLLHLATHIAFIGSLRNGETVGITVNNLHPDLKAIDISATLMRINHKALEMLPSAEVFRIFPNRKPNCKTCLVLKPPKTDASKRRVFLNDEVFKEINLRLEEIEKHKRLHGEEYQDYDLLICNDDGSPIEPQRLMDKFSDWQKKHATNYPPIDFHGIRHSATTYKLVVSGGDIKAVQNANGQATAKMVTDVYAHVEEKRNQALAKKVERDFYSKTEACTGDSIKSLIDQITANPSVQQQVLLALVAQCT